MKVIDQTPLQSEDGEIGIVQRVQGTFKYGFDWYAEMEAQKVVLAHLSRILGKGYTVIRNPNVHLSTNGLVYLCGPNGLSSLFPPVPGGLSWSPHPAFFI